MNPSFAMYVQDLNFGDNVSEDLMNELKRLKNDLPAFAIRHKITHQMTHIVLKAYAKDFYNTPQWLNAIRKILHHPLNIHGINQKNLICDIETCAKEAINNAIIHGTNQNIAKNNLQKDTFSIYYNEIEKNINKPNKEQLTITMKITVLRNKLSISVEDEGAGYDPQKIKALLGLKKTSQKTHQNIYTETNPLPPFFYNRRGLFLIYHSCQSVRHTKKGRRIKMYWKFNSYKK